MSTKTAMLTKKKTLQENFNIKPKIDKLKQKMRLIHFFNIPSPAELF